MYKRQITTGPIASSSCGLIDFENSTYPVFGKRIRSYLLIDPLQQLSAASKSGRDIAKEGFCIIPFNSSNQILTDNEVDTLEIRVTADGRISSPSFPLNLQIKYFDPDSGETDDSDAWNILIDPVENRIRLQHPSAGRL